MWVFNGKEFTSDDIGDHVGFVYCITNKQDGKRYIGKKLFWSTRTLKPLKGKKRKRKKVVESDWKMYYGSSTEVQTLLEEFGPDNFEREILHLCDSKGDLSYMELKEQMDRDVLFNDDYYNQIINVRINSTHLKNVGK